jgi:hypothetical protein
MFVVSVCENAIVTALIVVRIWHFSPHNRRDVLGANFSGGAGRAALAIVIESGLLYFSVQLIYCILYGIGNPAELIVTGIALQIYVRNLSPEVRIVVDSIPQSHRASHRH